LAMVDIVCVALPLERSFKRLMRVV
jgi:hypothetical protein